MQEPEEIHIDETTQRPHALRGEVALPQRMGMARQELVPRTPAPFGTRIETIFLQNVLNRLAADSLDAQLAELTQDARVSPGFSRASFRINSRISSVVRGRPGLRLDALFF